MDKIWRFGGGFLVIIGLLGFFAFGKLGIFFILFVVLGIAFLMAIPLTNIGAGFIVGMLNSKEKIKPKPMYGISETLVSKGDYRGAVISYQNALEKFPKDLKLYISLIEVSTKYLKNEYMTTRFYQKGMKNVKKEELSLLTDAYNAYFSTLKEKADWQIESEERVKHLDLNKVKKTPVIKNTKRRRIYDS